jgi:hypothetical protein
MIQSKVFIRTASAVICSLLLTAGCAPVEKEAVPKQQIPKAGPADTAVMALKFTGQDSTTYRLLTQTEDGVRFGGSLSKDPQFRDKHNRNKVLMVFEQRIQDVDDKGNALAEITIKELRCIFIYQNRVVLKFVGAAEDANSPLANLIGQSYTIEITPQGRVENIVDASRARAAVAGDSSAHQAALKLLSDEAIRHRHGTLILPQAGQNQLRTGQSWSNVEDFSFGMMGNESYEKVYTLKQIKDDGTAARTAVVAMEAIPASQAQPKQPSSSFLDMFDSTRTYTGRLRLDLDNGKIEQYYEKLKSEGTAVDPQAAPQDANGPDTVKIGIIRIYDLQKVD